MLVISLHLEFKFWFLHTKWWSTTDILFLIIEYPAGCGHYVVICHVGVWRIIFYLSCDNIIYLMEMTTIRVLYVFQRSRSIIRTLNYLGKVFYYSNSGVLGSSQFKCCVLLWIITLLGKDVIVLLNSCSSMWRCCF